MSSWGREGHYSNKQGRPKIDWRECSKTVKPVRFNNSKLTFHVSRVNDKDWSRRLWDKEITCSEGCKKKISINFKFNVSLMPLKESKAHLIKYTKGQTRKENSTKYRKCKSKKLSKYDNFKAKRLHLNKKRRLSNSFPFKLKDCNTKYNC